MRRTSYIAAALVAYLTAGWWFWSNTQTHYSPDSPYDERCPIIYGVTYGDHCTSITSPYPWWINTTLIGIALLVGLIFTIKACNDNIYHVRSGRVIDKKWYRAETSDAIVGMFGIVIPAAHHPAQYKLLLRRSDGKVGWVNVTKDHYASVDYGDHVDVR